MDAPDGDGMRLSGSYKRRVDGCRSSLEVADVLVNLGDESRNRRVAKLVAVRKAHAADLPSHCFHVAVEVTNVAGLAVDEVVTVGLDVTKSLRQHTTAVAFVLAATVVSLQSVARTVPDAVQSKAMKPLAVAGSERARRISSQSERCRTINQKDLSTWAMEASSTGAKKQKDTVSLFMSSIKTLPRPARQRSSLLASKTSSFDDIVTRPPHQPTLATSSPDHFITLAPCQPTTCAHDHLVAWPLSAGDGRIE